MQMRRLSLLNKYLTPWQLKVEHPKLDIREINLVSDGRMSIEMVAIREMIF